MIHRSGCCSACSGAGAGGSARVESHGGLCWDCRGTGHPHRLRWWHHHYNPNGSFMSPVRLPLAAAAFVLSVVLANVLTNSFGLIPAGFGLQVTAGTYAAGFALLARDFTQRYATDQYGRRHAIGFTLALVAFAGALSWALASPGLALASTVAFVGAELVDLLVFTPLRDRVGFGRAALASNVVSAPLDTVLFLAIAGFPLTIAAVGGQFVAKVLYATGIPLALWALVQPPRERTATA